MRHPNPTILEVGMRVDFESDGIASNLLLEQVLKNGGTIYQTGNSGYTEKKLADLTPIFENRGATRFSERVYGEDIEDSASILFAWKDGMADFSKSDNGHISFTMTSLNKELVAELRRAIDPLISEVVQQGYVFAITRPGGGSLQLARMGYAGISLERGNYSKRVLSDYDFAVRDLKSSSPSGRILILEGDPGTGKSFLIRSLLMEVPDAMHVLVPPSMVSSLGGPDLLPLLLQNKESWSKKGPTVLILEDADECLVPRQGDNMQSISSLLNMGDGIFGSIFDVRIIATTNAKKAAMDAAILRAGRLSKRIEVGAMNYDEASAVFHRLLSEGKQGEALAQSLEVPMPTMIEEDEAPSMKPRGNKKSVYTLAEIYKAARETGWEPKKIKAKASNEALAYTE